jgi:hypothetical protein
MVHLHSSLCNSPDNLKIAFCFVAYGCIITIQPHKVVWCLHLYAGTDGPAAIYYTAPMNIVLVHCSCHPSARKLFAGFVMAAFID